MKNLICVETARGGGGRDKEGEVNVGRGEGEFSDVSNDIFCFTPKK